MREGGRAEEQREGGEEMNDETVHASRMKERLSFEVSVKSSEMLSLLKEIMETTKTLSGLSYRLMETLEVMGNDESR